MSREKINQERLQQIRKDLTEAFNRPIPDHEIQKAMPGIMYRRSGMIELTKLNGTKFTMNADLIEVMEATPDSVISLVTGRKYIVKEPIDEIMDKYYEYKRQVNGAAPILKPRQSQEE